jgi:hypothetical protein
VKRLSKHRARKLVSTTPERKAFNERPAKVALVTVATGNYGPMAEAMLKSARKWFFPAAEKREFFCLSDQQITGFTCLPVPHLAWPGPTLWRWSRIWAARHAFKGFDAVFYCDADMRFEDIVQFPVKGMVATIHPGYYRTAVKPFENRRKSACYTRGKTYFCGGFMGGLTGQFLNMARMASEWVEQDHRNGIVPVWHDESATNCFFSKMPPALALDPGYCYPEKWRLPFQKRLSALTKEHAEVRSAEPFNPKVGIVLFHDDMPRYRKEWVSECLASLRAQSRVPRVYEVCYGKGKSLGGFTQGMATTNRPEIANYAEAQNEAMRMAFEDGCDYVLNVNLDDVYQPDYVEKTVNYAMRHGLDIASCDMRYIDESGKAIKEIVMSDKLPEVEFAKGHNIIAHPATCWSRRFWEAGYRMNPARIPQEDFDCWRRALAGGMRIGIQPEILLNYRIHSGQVSA